MTVSKNYSLNTRDKANDSVTGNRTHHQSRQLREAGQYQCIITVVRANSYDAGLVDELGNVIGVEQYVRAWGTAEFTVDDKAWLVYAPGLREPYLQAAGGACDGENFREWGLVY